MIHHTLQVWHQFRHRPLLAQFLQQLLLYRKSLLYLRANAINLLAHLMPFRCQLCLRLRRICIRNVLLNLLERKRSAAIFRDARAVVDAVKIPVTVKTRLGWDANNKIIVELAEQLQDCGIAALTIHGRTRAQMYTGEADWTLIGEVKKNPRMHIPIIGNGDITSPQRAKECFDLYGVDAIMIGRASFGRPWIFKEVRHYLEAGEELPPLSAEWKLSVLRQEVVDSVNLLDERRGILHVRRHLAASPLFKGIPNFRETRIAMLRAETKEELFRIFDDITPILHSPA